ncbi:hypothetical protein D3C72_2309230 [compost metagenome]
MLAEKIGGSKRGRMPVTVSDSSIRSGCDEEATHQAMLSASSASNAEMMPSVGRSSARNRA